MCNEWKHPSYYKELAKVRKEFEEKENSKTAVPRYGSSRGKVNLLYK